jgi:integrase
MNDFGHNPECRAPEGRAIVLAEANSSYPLKGLERMARRRFQRGQLKLRGKRNPVWVGRYREDIIRDGKIVRLERWNRLGTKEDYPTRKLARRALDDILSNINNVSYRPRPVAKFSEFAEKWVKNVVEQEKPSCKAPERSRLKKHLLPMLGDVAMKDINTELLQSGVAYWSSSGVHPKTIKNLIAQLRSMWNSAQAWEYVGESDPFKRLRLPGVDEAEQPVFDPEAVRNLISAAEPPFDTVYWLLAQTGIRRGEVCALDVGDVDYRGVPTVTARHSRSGKNITDTKSRRKRVFKLSPRLAERLRLFTEGRPSDAPLFLTKKGKRLHPDNFVKRHLTPLVKMLGLKGGLHAFRHGNASALDELGIPMKTRQERLGHQDPRTTMKYTHKIVDADVQLAEQLDELFCPLAANQTEGRVM